MGWLTSLFGSAPSSEEEIQKIIHEETPKHELGGVAGLIRGHNPQFEKKLSSAIKRKQHEQYYDHERQEREMEQRRHDYERPETARYWDQSLGLSRTKDELARLKAAGDPYASNVEYNLKYVQQQYDKYMHDYDTQWERQKYDRKYAFQQQQKDYSNQTYEQAYKQLEASRHEYAKRQAINQAIHTQSNTPGRGGRGEQPLGRGQRFKNFGPPQARGSFGRGGPRPSFTRAGK